MCPLQYLIELLDSFKCFKNTTQTRIEEYESCKTRFHDYMVLFMGRNGHHMKICDNFTGKREIIECGCYEYLYNTPLALIHEIYEVFQDAVTRLEFFKNI